jgi:hypothetical protein
MLMELDKNGTPVFDHATLCCGESTIFIAGHADTDRNFLQEASSVLSLTMPS